MLDASPDRPVLGSYQSASLLMSEIVPILMILPLSSMTSGDAESAAFHIPSLSCLTISDISCPAIRGLKRRSIKPVRVK